jgi:hypothetical protein
VFAAQSRQQFMNRPASRLADHVANKKNLHPLENSGSVARGASNQRRRLAARRGHRLTVWYRDVPPVHRPS